MHQKRHTAVFYISIHAQYNNNNNNNNATYALLRVSVKQECFQSLSECGQYAAGAAVMKRYIAHLTKQPIFVVLCVLLRRLLF